MEVMGIMQGWNELRPSEPGDTCNPVDYELPFIIPGTFVIPGFSCFLLNTLTPLHGKKEKK